MKPLTTLQRDVLKRRIAREIAWYHASRDSRDRYNFMADAIVSGLVWTGVHGASEKRAVELVVAQFDETA